MANKKKSTNWIVVSILIALMAGVIVASTTDFFAVAPVSDYPEGVLDYPTASNSKVFEPIYGRIVCTNEGLPKFIYEQGSFVYTNQTSISIPSNIDYEGSNYHWIQCPAEYGEDCEVEITNFNCDYEGAAVVEKIYQIGINSEEREFLGDRIIIPSGSNQYIEIACFTIYDKFWSDDYIVKPTTSTANYIVRTRQMKLELQDPQGITKFGFLDGTEGCKLVSRDANTLKDLQIAGQSEVEGIDKLSLGQDYNVILGWNEVSGANINPLGRYKNYDYISCIPYTGIYSLEKVYTEGGRSYFKQDELLVSYTGSNTMCCGEGQCAGGYVCENYVCVEEAVCEFGECNPNFYVETEDCVEKYENGKMKFYLVSTSCGDDGCIQKRMKEVKCCRDYCEDVYGPDYYCDYSEGCVYTPTLSECPAGMCCLEGYSHKPRPCPSGQICCVGQVDGGNGLDVGICKAVCGPTLDEICFDGKDNDGDGTIDESDCIIDCSVTPNAEACQQADVGGINWFLVIASLIGGGVGAFFGWKWTKTIEKKWMKILLIILIALGFFFLFYFVALGLVWIWNKIVWLFSGGWLVG